jgi:hypothetical protein
MDTKKERLALEREIARHRQLAREYPDGQTGELIRGFIEELERQIRLLDGNR